MKPLLSDQRDSDGLRPVQRKVLDMYLAGATWSSCAAVAGVDHSTIANWRRGDPAFQVQLANGLQELRDESRAQLSAHLRTAVGALVDVMDDETAPAAARVSAAKVVIDRARDDEARADAEHRLAQREDVDLRELGEIVMQLPQDARIKAAGLLARLAAKGETADDVLATLPVEAGQ